MSTNALRWAVTFTVKKSYTQEFLDWMEKDHIPKIHDTGLFEKGYDRILEIKTEGGYDVVQYIHTPLSLDSWNIYEHGPRLRLRKEFKDEWGGAIDDGDLKMVPVVGIMQRSSM